LEAVWVSFKSELCSLQHSYPLDVTVLTDSYLLSPNNNPERKKPMAKRQKMKNSTSRANFSRNAGVHPRNNQPTPMRGGIRF